MNKFKTSQYIRIILLLLIVIVIVAFIWINNKSKNENEIFLNDYALVQEIRNLQNEGKMQEVITDLEILQKKYPEEYQIAFQLGIAYLNVGQYESAKTMYTLAIDLFPMFVEDKEFMYQYAVILANMEEIENAKVVIERAKTLSSEEEYLGRLASLLEQIER